MILQSLPPCPQILAVNPAIDPDHKIYQALMIFVNSLGASESRRHTGSMLLIQHLTYFLGEMLFRKRLWLLDVMIRLIQQPLFINDIYDKYCQQKNKPLLPNPNT